FSLLSFDITGQASLGGSITPASQSIEYGKPASLVLTPDTGYEIDTITGCPGSLDGNTYTTDPITTACAVNASFKLKTYQATAQASTGGSVSPNSQTVNYGETAQFALTPDTGYSIGNVSGCGGSLTGTTYTTGAITANCSINASFKRIVADDAILVTVENESTNRPLLATLSKEDDEKELIYATSNDAGEILFEGVDPNEEYILTVSQAGYRFSNELTSARQSRSAKSSNVIHVTPGEHKHFSATHIDGLENNVFTYHWSEDISTAGNEYSSYINEDLPIEVVGPDYSDVDSHATNSLYSLFGIILEDSGVPWSPEHAYRLLESLKQTGLEAFPKQIEGGSPAEHPYASRWQLVKEAITNDIRVISADGELPTVQISINAFTYANPTIATVDGKRGRFFSNRLFKSAVRFITDDGQNIELAAKILKERYGVIIATDRYFGGRYSTLPVISEDRNQNIWQPFQPQELIEIIAMLEEFPQGMRRLDLPNSDGGLRYLLRRANGLPHPLYDDAPAVAWTSANYIEFMETAFTQSFLGDIQRLIVHEKSHFLWDYAFSTELKYEWLKLSGWYRPGAGDGNCQQWAANSQAWTPENVNFNDLEALTKNHDHPKLVGEPVFDDAWASCSTTQFVTAYAARLNPNEDMAESMAYFLTNPDLLRSRALPKYEFIRDHIMQGSIYLSVIRPDLTFEVLNLYPDYVYPGKINRVDIRVEGAGDEDKQVTVELGLHVNSECAADNDKYCFDGASSAYMRLLSPIGTFVDQRFRPLDSGNKSSKLVARFTIPAEAASGWWVPTEIVTFDSVGNRRVEKLASSDYGWRLFVNNVNADVIPPKYVTDSLELKLFDTNSPNSPISLQDGEQLLQVNWLINENVSMENGNCFTRISDIDTTSAWGGRSYDQYSYQPQEINTSNEATHLCQVNWLVTRFIPQGAYGPRYVRMRDKALNVDSQYFTANHATHEEPKSMTLGGSTPDTVAPHLNQEVCATNDISEACLRVTAEPLNPESPNGETKVKIYYWAYEEQPLDFASGLAISGLRLRNPQGQLFHFWHSKNDNVDPTTAPDHVGGYFCCHAKAQSELEHCDATTPIQYVFETILPVGSAPGTWGLVEMSVEDLAGNTARHQFTEALRFDVE
ncbi:InlB B-repeat-containing protein, partial [Paraferrimonas haliotis]|uniref:InlB B-repeat-containing protein n=1 Tax=Paraferrimonas haliotis TaxID=2013866 RepID=UPI003CC81C90